MYRRTFLFTLGALFVPTIVRAEHYLDPQQAARLIFPEAEAFAPAPAQLSADQVAAVRQKSGVRVRQRMIEARAARKGGQTVGWVYIDEVIGKHEFITYAVGIDAGGEVRGVEILDYRETHGGQVRETGWRAQFRGLSLSNPPQLGKDIRNISGATLSCRNVTDGVRRLLATHAVLGR